MSITLQSFFDLYLIFLGIFVIFVLINLAHLLHTGTLTVASTVVTVIVVGFAFLIISTSLAVVQNSDLSQPVFTWSGSLSDFTSL